MRCRRNGTTSRSDRTLEYVRAFRKTDDLRGARLAGLDPEIFAACQLKCEDPRTVFEIELRVLCRQTYAQIAECCGVSPEVVEAYEQVFYDVPPG